MKHEIKLLPCMMPNFLPYEISGKTNISQRIPVEDLTKEEAEQYGELMKQEFIKHWKKKIK